MSILLTDCRWIGDAARVIMSKAVIEEILSKNLIEQTVRVPWQIAEPRR
jgi:hypothetical protein